MPLNVLITGANSGFGLLTARKFAEAGHTVHASLRTPSKGGALEAMRSEGLPVEIVRLDVTDPASIAQAVAAAQTNAPIDVLVNNAGFEIRGPIELMTDDLMLRQFDTNVLGVVRMVRAVAPGMRARRSGTIINVTSAAGHLGQPFAGAYSASKHAVAGLSEVLWFELRPFGVRVVAVAPGFFETAFDTNIIMAPGFDETSPYAAASARFHAAMDGFRAGPPQHPQEVADLIFEAAVSPDPKLRIMAGDDARTLVPLHRRLEFEEYAAGILAQLGLTDVFAPPETAGAA